MKIISSGHSHERGHGIHVLAANVFNLGRRPLFIPHVHEIYLSIFLAIKPTTILQN
jgi:hypothetical protein